MITLLLVYFPLMGWPSSSQQLWR